MVTGRVKLLPFPVSNSSARVRCHPTSSSRRLNPDNCEYPDSDEVPPYEKKGLFDCNSLRPAEIIWGRRISWPILELISLVFLEATHGSSEERFHAH